MEKQNDQIFQLSLTEIAFTIAFILLLMLGYLVFKEETGRLAAEAALTKVQTVEQAIVALNTAKSALAVVLKDAGTQNPDAVISKLIAEGGVRAERDRLRQQVVDLDAKLTSLNEIQSQIEEVAMSNRPDITKEAIESALALQSEWKKQFKKMLDKDIKPGQEIQAVQEVLSAAKSFNDLVKAGSSPDAIMRENSDLRGQVAFMKNRLDARGGRDFPPCWADEGGKPEFLFSIEMKPDSVLVTPAWTTKREAAAHALPGIAEVLAGPYSNQSFISNIQGVFNWSKNQNPECRHYIKLKSAISDAVQSDRARLMVENYFYKLEVHR